MSKNVATWVTLLAAFLAIVLPTGLAIFVARNEALSAEVARALQYARDVIHRTDLATDQIDQGITALGEAAEPCSAENLAVMRRIDVGSSYIQAIGHIDGTVLRCSSVGEVRPVDLGPPDIVRDTGVKIRLRARLPFVPDRSFIAVERDGFVAIIHKGLPIDITTAAEDVGIATLSQGQIHTLTSRGDIDPRWIERLEGRQEVTFVSDDHIVAVVASQRYLTIALASLPIARLVERTHAIALTVVPVGMLAGLVMALAVLYLARLQLALPAVIRVALRRKEFFLLYQPVVDLATGRWVGAEALLRWRRPNGELVAPELFIKAAEDSGVIERVTRSVYAMVTPDARRLFAAHPDFHVSINLSAADLHSARTVDRLWELVRATRARPGNLMVEVTERGLVRPDVARGVLRGLRAHGIAAAIDDFGTGYSSLSYLETFEVDALKIDRSFVNTVATEAATSHVILHIIEMAKALNLAMIAEGVETEAQAQFLRERGVQRAQGFLYGKPMPLADLLAGLATRGA